VTAHTNYLTFRHCGLGVFFDNLGRNNAFEILSQYVSLRQVSETVV